MIKRICDRCKKEIPENEFNMGLVVVDSKWDLCNNCKEALENFMLNEVAHIKVPVTSVTTSARQKSDKVLKKPNVWRAKPSDDAETVKRILELKKNGLSRREISRRLAIKREIVNATVTDLEAKGLLEKDVYSGKVRGGWNHATLPDSEKITPKKKQKSINVASIQQDYYKDIPKMIQKTVTDNNGCILEVEFVENH